MASSQSGSMKRAKLSRLMPCISPAATAWGVAMSVPPLRICAASPIWKRTLFAGGLPTRTLSPWREKARRPAPAGAGTRAPVASSK